MQKLINTITLSVALTLVGGCSYVGVYKRDLPQGNLITEEMVEQLQPGMSREQVVDVMGGPLLEAPFNANEWDYVFRLDEAYGGVEQRRVTLTFGDDGRLASIDHEGDLSDDIELRAPGGVGPGIEGAEPIETMPSTQPIGTSETGGTPLPAGGEPASSDELDL